MEKSRGIKSISEIQPSFFSKKKEVRGEHNEMINNILEFMSEDNYGKWCKRLKGYTPSQIHDAIKISSKKKCPPAYFNYLLKNKMI